MISGILVVCFASLVVAMCVVWYLRRKIKYTHYIGKTESSTAAAANDMVVYDVPVFKNNQDTLMKCNGINDGIIVHQNNAYGQVCIH